MIQETTTADLERLLIEARDGVVHHEAISLYKGGSIDQISDLEDDPERAALYAAAAYNAGGDKAALRLAETILDDLDVSPDTRYMAAWLVVSLSTNSAKRSEAIGRARQYGLQPDQIASLEFKNALRSLDAETLKLLVPDLLAAGLPKAAALAEAEALFLSKKWKAAAVAYEEFLGDDPWRIGVVERRAYALIRSYRPAEARRILNDLPMRSGVTQSLLDLHAANRRTIVQGVLMLTMVPVMSLVLLIAWFGALGMLYGNERAQGTYITIAIVVMVVAMIGWIVRAEGARRFARGVMRREFGRGPLQALRGDVARLGTII